MDGENLVSPRGLHEEAGTVRHQGFSSRSTPSNLACELLLEEKFSSLVCKDCLKPMAVGYNRKVGFRGSQIVIFCCSLQDNQLPLMELPRWLVLKKERIPDLVDC